MKSENEIISGIMNGDIPSYKKLFELFYKKLFQISLQYVRKKEVAEEIVQDLYIYIWESRRTLKISTSIEAYLITSVKNRSINYLKSKYGNKEYLDISKISNSNIQIDSETKIEVDELKNIIANAIDNLPAKCSIIYHLSRNADMTYQQIADELNIGKETVKTQMGIALKKIREYLNKYWEQLPE